MRRTVVRAVVLAALAALLLAAAACGGDDDESSASPPAAAVETEADDGAMTEETTETEASDDSSSDANFGSAANCKELAELGAKVSEALGGTGADTEKTKEFLNEFADSAPDEIKDDFKVIAEAYGKIVDAVGDIDVSSGATPDPETLAKLAKLATEIDQEELTQANTNITAWVTKNCGGTVTTS